MREPHLMIFISNSSARAKARQMDSKCCVVFFDEIDALGRSRVDEDSGKMSQAGGDNSSRRILAELLIQMTELATDNGEAEESEEEEECVYCDDGDSFTGRSTISTGTGTLNQHDVNIDDPMVSSDNDESKAQTNEQEVGTPSQEGNTIYNTYRMHQPKPRVIVVGEFVWSS